MSAAFQVSVYGNAKAAALKQAEKAKNPGPGLLIAARALGNMCKKHFRDRNKTPNKLGGTRTNYWLQVAQSVQAPEQTSPTEATLAISDPTFSHKVTGGVIRAKAAKALTVPIHPEAHGRRASVLENALGIKLFRVKDVLMGAGKDGNTVAYYALRKQVTQKPDSQALPPKEEMQREAITRFTDWMTTT